MSDEIPDLTPQILIQIRDELRRHSDQFVEMKAEISDLGVTMKRGFDDVNLRIDNLILAAGAGRGDHERRIARLERRVEGLEKPK